MEFKQIFANYSCSCLVELCDNDDVTNSTSNQTDNNGENNARISRPVALIAVINMTEKGSTENKLYCCTTKISEIYYWS